MCICVGRYVFVFLCVNLLYTSVALCMLVMVSVFCVCMPLSLYVCMYVICVCMHLSFVCAWSLCVHLLVCIHLSLCE